MHTAECTHCEHPQIEVVIAEVPPIDGRQHQPRVISSDRPEEARGGERRVITEVHVRPQLPIRRIRAHPAGSVDALLNQ
jgi:hypothetical protein